MNRDVAGLADELGVSVTWVYRNAPHLAHHRFGRKYVFTDDDVRINRDRFARNQAPRPVRDPSAPVTRRRAS